VNPSVVVAGHLCLDIIPPFQSKVASLTPGSLSVVGPALLTPGGGVANVGLSLFALGIPAKLIGYVGDDAFGAITRERFSDHHPEAGRYLQVSQTANTSYTVVISPPETDRMFLHYPGCNDAVSPADIDRELLADARIVYFGYPPLMQQSYLDGGSALTQLFMDAKDQGAITILDLAMPDMGGAAGQVDWAAFLAGVLPYVDIIMPSFEELLLMLEPAAFYDDSWRSEAAPSVEQRQLAARLIQLGAAAAIITLGKDGMLLRSAESNRFATSNLAADWSSRELWVPALPTTVVGTTGAGDASVAGLIAALLHHQAPIDALRCAAAVGACSVTASDATSGIPRWQDLQRRLSGWPTTPHLSASGWSLVAEGVYSGPYEEK
jgi:sugar/nucleoside kinase (ribokinase family)